MARAAIVTVGNELLAGDVENTNGSWLARRLAALGVEVGLIAVIGAPFVRTQADGGAGTLGQTLVDVGRASARRHSRVAMCERAHGARTASPT